jgi:hypothetical protein
MLSSSSTRRMVEEESFIVGARRTEPVYFLP